MIRLYTYLIAAATLFCFSATPADAHFGVIIPSENIITEQTPRTVELSVKFMHPMEAQYLNMEKPKRFGVAHMGKVEELLNSLSPVHVASPGQEGSLQAWKASFTFKKPGDYVFFVEPAPYWEASENKYIIHYTKVCVNAFGLEQGWDKPLGLETEIVPLARPYGIWTGNVFRGRVLIKGKPVPNAEVEVEYLNDNPDGQIKPPSPPFVTQTLRCDSNGVFVYAMPRAGWWGFAALSDARWKLKKDGKPKDVELGAVYWVKTVDMK